jgi:hypothetical protein
VNTLVLLGDIFELATARIASTARSGRSFFTWLFDWLKPKQVIYVPGNHDHVFWMWWKLASTQWWRSGDDPAQVKDELARLYAELPTRTSHPTSPESAQSAPGREDLLSYFFGDPSRRPSAIRLAYPAYTGPLCSPPGFRGRLYETLFTHGHLNDPTFIRPGDSGIVARVMHGCSDGATQPVEMSSLESIEATTWRYTHHFWYPANKDTTTGERLYLFVEKFSSNNPCVHHFRHAGRFVQEPAADLESIESSPNDYYALVEAALGSAWYTRPLVYVYGHTHHGGTMALDPTTVLYNTGGWIRVGNDSPRHTHLFMVDATGCAKMVRVPFRHS